MARPIQKQIIDKGQVWTTFIGGAVVLFLGTLALENNSAFFPAISRANKASAEMRKATEVSGFHAPSRPADNGWCHCVPGPWVVMVHAVTSQASEKREKIEATTATEVDRQTRLVEEALAEAKRRRALAERSKAAEKKVA